MQALDTGSRGEMTAVELHRRLGGASHGDVLRLLREAALPLPRAPAAGRAEQLKRARARCSRNAPRNLKIFLDEAKVSTGRDTISKGTEARLLE